MDRSIKIYWNESQRNAFALRWPCCDIPASGFFELDSKGELVDISQGTDDCQPSGGLSEFIDSLIAESIA
jgi:hypothetical protein